MAHSTPQNTHTAKLVGRIEARIIELEAEERALVKARDELTRPRRRPGRPPRSAQARR